MSEAESDRSATKGATEAAKEVLRFLRQQPKDARFDDIRAHCVAAGLKHTSVPTIRRGLHSLREVHDCPLVFDKAANTWTLLDPDFSLPLDDPTPGDLTAVIFARALIGPVVSSGIEQRLERLVEEMDARVRESEQSGDPPSSSAVSATLTTGAPVDPKLLSTLLLAISKRRVLKLQYYSPWQDKERSYEVEPWQLRVHDGTMYLRAWSRTRHGARSFRVSQLRSALVLDAHECREPRPPQAQLWGESPAVGVDDDRPDTAVLTIRGGLARWVQMDHWHAEQEDRWLEPGELLERRVPYRSCRELARRLLSLGDALVGVEPAELRAEIAAHARALVERTG